MYAIIRAGGKQAKVSEGDVIDVERIKTSDSSVSFRPLLVVGDDGRVITDPEVLDAASVTAEILGEHRGTKIDIFKYKAKTGYRRRMGHRQTYTTIRITGIAVPSVDRDAAEAAPAGRPEDEEG
ncbi:MAG TPA: 50S ribosomal protein L21 [Actinobacteria bacterium]|nr:50S ribosomal protein L21 [Actinomycetota bacterium]